ncbi:MAG: hypothetical protein QOC79_2995, partial [Actinomycetota bacterium]|nr:hypothetical protein [Actinomycetota bacterium]
MGRDGTTPPAADLRSCCGQLRIARELPGHATACVPAPPLLPFETTESPATLTRTRTRRGHVARHMFIARFRRDAGSAITFAGPD